MEGEGRDTHVCIVGSPTLAQPSRHRHPIPSFVERVSSLRSDRRGTMMHTTSGLDPGVFTRSLLSNARTNDGLPNGWASLLSFPQREFARIARGKELHVPVDLVPVLQRDFQIE